MNCSLESRELAIALKSDVPVLLMGPTGSGKSSLAKWIHEHSKRESQPFATINLATLAMGTFESELFGHERGAYTGAEVRRMGRLESAQGGTVFLDEIGDLPLEQQAKLLEFLQTGVVYPLGSNRQIGLNVRIIAATHRDLAREVDRGRFREDLFHRLRLIAIELPSLASLSADFDSIVHGILQEMCARYGRRLLSLSPLLAEALENYPWPGNFRELRHVLEYCVLAARTECLEFEDLPDWFRRAGAGAHAPQNSSADLGSVQLDLSLEYEKAFNQFERTYFAKVLGHFGGRVSRAASEIGVSRSTLLRRLKTHGMGGHEVGVGA